MTMVIHYTAGGAGGGGGGSTGAGKKTDLCLASVKRPATIR